MVLFNTFFDFILDVKWSLDGGGYIYSCFCLLVGWLLFILDFGESSSLAWIVRMGLGFSFFAWC